jgi:hypothetical protein
MSTAVAKRAPINEALATTDGVDKSDVRGKGNIDRGDVVLPRLAICQSTSPEKKKNEPNYIAGLEEGQLFNSLLQTNYGEGPVTVAIIDVYKRALEFEKDPQTGKDTKKIIDFNVPWDDARCEFTDGPNGRKQPLATRFYDYLALVIETGEAVIISMSKTKIPVAKKLNSFLGLRVGPTWAGLYQISAVAEKKNDQNFYNFSVKPAGKTPPEVLASAETLYEQFKGKVVTAEVVGDDEGGGSTTTDGRGVPF